MSRRIGRYEIQAELGRGGFGQVFRAYDPTVGRHVAIKTLTSTGDPDLSRRFRNEAAAAGKLRHPNIVIIYDFGEYEDTPYLVMELLDGQDLERSISSGQPLSLLQQLDIIAQAASGLHHAHSNGIVHRDIKPANIMLQRDGVVKIMDFGIALLSQLTAARVTPKGAMIGTLPYMAPEQFQGAISDVLTDIFAFGITCYRLLTGRHPFYADEMAGLMYNVLNRAPTPLRSLSPECPEALEQAVLRMLAKDRESRYQSMEDVRFDLEPVSFDLRRERVHGLIEEARSHISSNRLDEANSVVRQALEADPANRTARDLRETLLRQIRENELRPRIAAYVSASREQIRAGEFESAIKNLESALHLDKSNAELQYMVNEARSAWEQAQKTTRKLDEARRSLDRGDITAAQRVLADALASDPHNAGAAALQAEIQRQIETRERERRLEEGLNHARRLLVLENYDEVISRLTSLKTEFANSSAVADLLTRATLGRKEREARQRLQAAIDGAKQLLKQESFGDAVKALAAARMEFPDSPELRDLAVFAEEELRAQNQTRAIAQVSAKARSLLEAGRHDQALETLRAALTEYPGANALRELTQEVAASQAAQERRAALQEATARTRALISEQRFHEASERIGSFVRAYGESAELDSIRKEIEEGLENQRRVQAVRQLMGDAQALLDQNRPDTATQVLQRGASQFPENTDLTGLLKVARNRLDQQLQAEAISKIISEAESLSRGRQFERAREILDNAIQEHGRVERLVRCREATVATEARQKREQEHKRALEYIEQARASGDLEKALRAIDVALKRFPADAALLTVRAQVESDRDQQARDAEFQRALEEGQRLIANGDLESATQILHGATLKFPGSEPLNELAEVAAQRLKQRQRDAEIATALSAARAAAGARRWEEALKTLDKARDAHGADPELDRLREEVLREQAAERDQLFNRLAANVQDLCAGQRYEDAIAAVRAETALKGDARLEKLQRDIQSQRDATRTAVRATVKRARELLDQDRASEAIVVLEAADTPAPEYEPVLRLARSRLAEQEREQAIGEIERSIQALLSAGRHAEAVEALDRALLEYPGVERLSRFRPSVIATRDRAQALGEARTLQARGDFDGAIQILAAALQKSPGNPELQELRRTIERDRDLRDRTVAIAAALEQARTLLKNGRPAEAESVLRPVAMRYPDEESVGELLREAEGQNRRAQREAQLHSTKDEADALLSQGKPSEALALLNSRFPGEPRIADLVARASEQVAWQRDKEALDRARQQLAEIEQRIAKTRASRLEALRADARRIAAAHPPNNELASIVARIESQIAAAVTVPAPPRKPLRWQPIAAVGAGVAAIAAGAFVFWPKSSPPPPPTRPPAIATRHVEIRTDPAGASVSVGDRSCIAPQCSFDLPDGEYEIQARLTGFLPASKPLRVDAAVANSTTTVTLSPEPPPILPGVKTGTVVVRTGIPGARVLVDGQAQGLTGSGGDLSLSLPSGQHTVRAEKGGYRASQEAPVAISDGGSASLVLTLAALAARFQIRGAPAGAEVRTQSGIVKRAENGKPFVLELQPGSQNLQISEGGVQRQITRLFEPGATLTEDWLSIAPVRNPPPKIDAEAQTWERIRLSTDPALFENYLKEYPSGPHVASAQTRLDDFAWDKVNRSDVASLQSYLSRSPRGGHFDEAQRLREKLVDEAAWAAVNRESVDSLQAFVNQRPGSPHRSEAQTIIDRLSKAAETETARKRILAQEKPGILAAIKRFNDAHLHKNPKEVKLVWPSAPPDWLDATNSRGGTVFIATLYPEGDPTINGERSSIRCELNTQTILRNKPETPTRVKVVVTLYKSGEQWVIDNPRGTP